MSATNPVREWLLRVAKECGSPDKMETWACCMRSENTKQLMMEYAKLWRRYQQVPGSLVALERFSGSGKA